MSTEALMRRLAAAKAAAKAAGQMLLAANDQGFSYENKAKSDLVTEFDYKSEQLLRSLLHKEFPNDNFLGEEEGFIAYGDGGTWIIDPIDGTSNFVQKIPGYTISIAYEDETGVPVLGVVYSPVQDELFWAVTKGGAYLNGEPIHTSDKREIAEAVTVAPPPLRVPALLDEHLILYREICTHSGDLRSFGTASLNLCYVAMGRIDGYFEFQIKYHDYAAAMVIIAESGGSFTSMHPEDAMPYRDVIASNGPLHPWYTERIQRLVGERVRAKTSSDIL